jgi:GNAT superfamily N-acetyltransferase
MLDEKNYRGVKLLITHIAPAISIIDDLVWDLWGRRWAYEEFWEIEDLSDEEANKVIRQDLQLRGIDPDAKSLLIDKFEISPSLRGRGLGTAAYRQIESDARRLGCKYIILQASIIDFDEDRHSFPFWHKMGFIELHGTTDYPIMYKAI